MKKLLITGGSGFVGSYLTKFAVENFEVFSAYSKHAPESSTASLIQLDLTEENIIRSILDQIKPEAIIHTAAISKPDECEKIRERTEGVNISATITLAEWAQKNEVRLVFTSSDMVFDGRQGNYSESEFTNPLSYYGETKARAEQLLLKMNFNCAVARVALVYGLGEFHHSNFFHAMVKHLQQDEKVNLFYDQFRTPIYVENLAHALLEMAENEFTGIIHLGGAERISRWDFGLKACEILNLSKELIQRTSMFDFPSAASRPRDVSMNIDLAKRVLRTKLLNCTEGLEHVKAQMQ